MLSCLCFVFHLKIISEENNTDMQCFERDTKTVLQSMWFMNVISYAAL